MTEPASESIIRKIEKCLALSKSSNEHEAAAALRQATKLMEAYNVTPEALTASQVGSCKAATDAWTRPPAWELQLLSVLKKAFGCEAILLLGDSDTKRLTVVVYIGVKHQAQLAVYAHDVLRRQVVKARAKFLDKEGCFYSSRGAKMSAGESFCSGYVSVLGKQASALSVAPEVQQAILLLKTDLLGGEGGKYNPARRRNDWAAREAGASAGAGASLHRPVGGSVGGALRLN